MKKLALAVAVAAISGQAAAVEVFSNDTTSLEVYGQLRTRLVKTNNDGEAAFDVANSRIGTTGTYKMNDDLTFTGRFQVKYADSDTNFFNDSLWIGMNSKKLGEVRIGSMYSIWDDDQGKHDFTYYTGGGAKLGSDVNGTVFLSNVLDYRLNLGQVTLRAQTIMSPIERNAHRKRYDEKVDVNYTTDGSTVTAETTSSYTKIDSAHIMGATWNSDFGLTLAGTYAATELETVTTVGTNDPSTSSMKDTKSMGLTASYSINDLTVGAQYTKVNTDFAAANTHDEDKTGYGFGAKYAMDYNLAPYFTYDNVKTEVKGEKDETTKTYVLGVEYKPSASIRAFAQGGRTKETGEKNETTFVVGARYYF